MVRPFGGQVTQQQTQPADAGRVKAVGGLIENQHPGVTQQRGGERQALTHPERKAARTVAGLLG